MSGPENKYEKRHRLLGELREEFGWEGAVLIRVDGFDGASMLSSQSEGASPVTRAIVAAIRDFLPGFISEAYKGAGAESVDFVDRVSP